MHACASCVLDLPRMQPLPLPVSHYLPHPPRASHAGAGNPSAMPASTAPSLILFGVTCAVGKIPEDWYISVLDSEEPQTCSVRLLFS
uniref:Uncharacterized protein n=1 Tax=Oryza nivara TaxID=4536 RepID=A0A0E0IA77_ORYNI